VSVHADDRAAPRARILRALTIAFVLLALARLSAIIAHEPLAGYANQYDMVRSAACIGLWPAGDPVQRALATPDAPRPAQVLDAPQPEGCYPSTDVALAWLGVALARGLDAIGLDGDPGIDLRAIGATKALLIALLLLSATRFLRAHPGAACAHAAFVAFVIADPLNTLYLNTLYTETGALLGAWLATLGLVLRAMPRADHRLAFAAVLVGAVVLGASRVQHLALPFGLALLWWMTARAACGPPGGTEKTAESPTHAPRASATSNTRMIPSPRNAGRGPGGVRGALAQTSVMLFAALAVVALQAGTQQRFESIAGANRQNMLFGALLPAAEDPARLAARLGLPAHCAELAYATWYRQLGRDIAGACPEATRPSLARIAVVIVVEPTTALALFGRGLVQSTAWRLPYVGEVAGGNYQRLAPGLPGLNASLADAVATWSLGAHALFWLLPALAGFGAAWRLLRARPRGATFIALDAGLAVSAGVIATVWATSILGDGYSELARHLHLAVSAACGGWLLLAIALWRDRPRAALQSVATLALALAICAAGARAPLAIGRLEPPATDAILAGTVPLAGWVLAPRGASAVELREGGIAVARFGVEPDPRGATLFPVADGALAWRFVGTLDAGASRARTLELFVISPTGSAQRIDRRRFDLAP